MVCQIEVEHTFLIVAGHICKFTSYEIGGINHTFTRYQTSLYTINGNNAIIVHLKDKTNLILIPQRSNTIAAWIAVALVESQIVVSNCLTKEHRTSRIVLGAISIVTNENCCPSLSGITA